MRAFTVALAVSLAACGGAQESAPPPNPSAAEPSPPPRRDCAPYAELARQVMLSRQAGVPMPDVMKLMQAHPDGPDLVVAAYEAPRYLTEPHQQREVTEFQNAAFLACTKETRRR